LQEKVVNKRNPKGQNSIAKTVLRSSIYFGKRFDPNGRNNLMYSLSINGSTILGRHGHVMIASSWIYNYLCNQYLLPLTWVRILSRRGVLDTKLCNKVCQWLSAGTWFSPGALVSSTNKTDRHDITEILLKVALNTISLTIVGNMYDASSGKVIVTRHRHI
jgi:hypothetical protein